MIWSKPLGTPYVQERELATPTPMAWALHELHAPSDEIFRTPTGDVEPTAEEVAALETAEREQLTGEAYEAGVIAGRAAAQAEFQQLCGGAMSAVYSAAAQIRENEARYLNALEDNLAVLATAVARQIIAREVRGSADVTVDLIRRAVTEFPIEEALRIRINPVDLTALAVAPGGDAVRIAPGREIAWIPDSRVIQGGCLVEGRDRILDGRVDTGLERVYRRLSHAVA